jgi:hypothetical protein
MIGTETNKKSYLPPKEKWGEYVIEFTLICLAVAVGFFAENLRENMAEDQLANELAKNLYSELRDDSIQVQTIIKIRMDKEASLHYVQAYFRDSSLTKLPRRFYPAFTKGLYIGTGFFFQPHDGILQQLINSGSLRYFKQVDVQKKVGELNVALENIRSRNDKEYNYLEQFNRQLILKHYDMDWAKAVKGDKNKIADGLEEYQQENKIVPAILKNLDSFNRDEACAIVFMYLQILEASRKDDLTRYVKANHELMRIIRANYELL